MKRQLRTSHMIFKPSLEHLEPRQMLAVSAVGDEFLVNDFTHRTQSIAGSQSAIVATDVNSIVVFEGKGPTDRHGVYAEVLGTNGGTTTPTFRVNSTRRGEQHAPSVAADATGSFVVAWAGRGVGDKNGVFFQRFNASGSPLGGETRVNTTIPGAQTSPAVAVAADGSFVIGWSGVGEGDASGVFLQRFDAIGTALGGEVLVNTTTADQQVDPALVFDSAGNLVVAWSSRHQDSSDWGVFAQRFDGAGDRLGGEFLWNATTTGSQQSVDLAAGTDGTAVAAWQSWEQDGDGWTAVASQLESDGTTLGDEVVLNNTTAGHQHYVAIGVAEDNQWLATWTTGAPDGAGWEVEARSFEADGTPEADAFAVNVDTSGVNSGHQHHSAVAIAGDNGLIAWSGRGALDSYGVHAQSYEVDLVDTGPPAAPNLAPIADLSAEVNSQVEVTVTATDDNARDDLTFSLDPDNAPDGATIEQIDNNTAIVRWTPSPLDENQSALLRVIVTDDSSAQLADQEDFTVTVGASPAPADLVGFAQALADANARFLGAAWNQQTTDQRELFEDGGQLLPFEEVTDNDRSPNQTGIDNNVDLANLPVWIFADDTRLEGVQSLQTLAAAANVLIPTSEGPFLVEIPDDDLLVGSPLHVPLDGYDPNGSPLTYSATTDNTGVTAEILLGNQSARIDVAGYGDMVFELFEQRAKRATDRVIALADDDFYDDIIFHRIIDGFVIQGGDPLGTGTGGSTMGDFDDQFHVDLQHNRSGLLSYAKGPDDTNDSQFFITDETTAGLRNLDFNHTIFGLLTEGEAARAAISGTEVEPQDSFPFENSRPTTDIVMNGIDIFADRENATLLLKADPGVSGPVNVTVTVTDEDLNTSQRTFIVTVANDTDSTSPVERTDGRPFLDDISPVSIVANTMAEIQLAATDVEGDSFVFEAFRSGDVNYTFDIDADTGMLTVTPPIDFTGPMEIEARVRRQVPIDGSDFDAQVISIAVT